MLSQMQQTCGFVPTAYGVVAHAMLATAAPMQHDGLIRDHATLTPQRGSAVARTALAITATDSRAMVSRGLKLSPVVGTPLSLNNSGDSLHAGHLPPHAGKNPLTLPRAVSRQRLLQRGGAEAGQKAGLIFFPNIKPGPGSQSRPRPKQQAVAAPSRWSMNSPTF